MVSEAVSLEDRLANAARTGELLDVTEETGREIPATTIRKLLLEQEVDNSDPLGIQIKGADIAGTLNLTDIKSGIPLILKECNFESPICIVRSSFPFLDITGSDFPALSATGLNCDSDLQLENISSASLILAGANITGNVYLNNAEIFSVNTGLPSFNIQNTAIGGDLFIGENFKATSDSSSGSLIMAECSIGGQINSQGASIEATDGPALNAEGAAVKGSLLLDQGFVAISYSNLGCIRLIGASITGQFSLRGAHIECFNGSALVSDKITIGKSLFLDAGVYAESNDDSGTIRLTGGDVTGEVFVTMNHIYNTGKESLLIDFQGFTISGDLTMPIPEEIWQERGEFCFNLDGLQYPFLLSHTGHKQWLRILRKNTVRYAAQPYQQLASVYRAAGHDREAREILIAQQDDLLHRGNLGGRPRKLLHRLSRAFIGYGHRPFLALAWLAGVCGLAIGLVLLAGVSGLAVQAHPNTGPCSIAESIGLGIDTAVPLLKTGGGQRCEIATTNGWGQSLYLGKYLLTIFGWAFATLFVAGYTGLVRRNT